MWLDFHQFLLGPLEIWVAFLQAKIVALIVPLVQHSYQIPVMDRLGFEICMLKEKIILQFTKQLNTIWTLLDSLMD